MQTVANCSPPRGGVEFYFEK